MKRREFIEACGLLGLAYPSFPSLAENRSARAGTVVIVGAGAAGMTAGLLLKEQGIRFQILEAADQPGGRMKRITSFTDFPISLGAEWLHVPVQELALLSGQSEEVINAGLRGYSGREAIGYFEDGHLSYSSLGEGFGVDFGDRKFVGSSWFDFFDEQVVPQIKDDIRFSSQITSINYEGPGVQLTDTEGAIYEADNVIVTVPLQVLRNNAITFVPSLPSSKLEAIQDAPIWGGIKVFIEFSRQFYPTYLAFPDSETRHGQRMYYDAAFAQDSCSNVLGLFAVGEQAKRYQGRSEETLIAGILQELDQVFAGEASRTYKQHVVQDWDKEPFVHSAYLADSAASYLSSDLFESIEGKVYFAGEAYTAEDDWGSVHNAARSAAQVVESITCCRS